MHHQHHHHVVPVRRDRGGDNNNAFVQTVVNTVIVDAPAETTGSRRENGKPLQMTRDPNAEPTTSYNVPARQQRPSGIQSADDASETLRSSSPSTNLASNTPFTSAGQQTAMISAPTPTPTVMSTKSAMYFTSATGLYAAGSLAPTASSLATTKDTTATENSGLSSGGKAGLAIAIILIIVLLAGLALYFIRRKKSADKHQRLDDEKSEMQEKAQNIPAIAPVSGTTNNAPRLSLRPVTQMFPPVTEKQDAGSLSANSNPPSRTRTPEPVSAASTNTSNESSNPFDDQDNAAIATPAAVATPTEPLMKERSGETRQQDQNKSQAFPTAVAGSRRNSPPGPGPENVHRVQLDFKPSMEDELELRAGSLVRLLHEYDDGWALCIRLDRSQQGVVPRTCISKLPVKPRPGPPPGAMRGPPPQGRPRGPSSAHSPRMGAPGAPRPMGSPGQQRSRAQSNAPRYPMAPPQARPRSNSDAMSARRASPPSGGPSPLASPASSPPMQAMPARKPVPGQAM